MPHAPGASTVGSIAWRQGEATLSRRTPRSVVIMTNSSDAAEPLQLVGTAIAVWDELAEPATDTHLVERVAARSGGEPHAIRSDVIATRTALGHIGAITEAR